MLYYLLNQELSGVSGVILFLGYILAIVVSLTVHEFSHAFVALQFGDDTAKLKGRLTFNPFAHFDILGIICFLFVGFGWAKPVPINPLRFKKFRAGMIWTSLAGIISNLLLALIFSLVYILLTVVFKVGTTEIGAAFISVASVFTTLNASLAVFNFLPIYPLDGFNFLAATLKQGNKFLEFMAKYGIFVLFGLIISGIFDFLIQIVAGGILTLFSLYWQTVLMIIMRIF
ncbi:MAG: site-2 protease family protein [Clostridia bacterium]